MQCCDLCSVQGAPLHLLSPPSPLHLFFGQVLAAMPPRQGSQNFTKKEVKGGGGGRAKTKKHQSIQKQENIKNKKWAAFCAHSAYTTTDFQVNFQCALRLRLRSCEIQALDQICPSHFSTQHFHRSHFGSRYTSGCCDLASLFVIFCSGSILTCVQSNYALWNSRETIFADGHTESNTPDLF
jgi:hypothetical protein